VFFALWPPARTAAKLAQWARGLARDTGGRATRQETIHLTLAFLGEVDGDRVDAAIAAARTVHASAHRLPVTQAEYWPHNRILWAGPARTPAATQRLALGLNKVLTRAGFVLERRAFAAHLTLIRKARAPCALPPLPTIDWPVDEFVLVRSRLSNEGSHYDVLERFPLQRRS